MEIDASRYAYTLKSEKIFRNALDNAARQAAPHTVGTFLARRLKGRAGNYKGHYERRILKRLEALEAAGHAKRVRSAGGRTAWLPID
ncbi:MAG: hypothetical protein KatS3mg038_3266 [Candidatus Kapaibacterium sp.]|nr:MAG: hypothetical protein KatS3mg038_3266 [Candidatus Kapabacteria bacterium]